MVGPNERAGHWGVFEGALDVSIFWSLLLLSGYNDVSSFAPTATLCLDVLLPTVPKYHA